MSLVDELGASAPSAAGGSAAAVSAAFAAAHAPGMNWATSESTLFLLSLGSESGRTRVERIRRAIQESRRDTWLREQHAERVGEDDSLARWTDVLAAQDEDWTRRLSEFRRQLEEGRFGGGPERD